MAHFVVSQLSRTTRFGEGTHEGPWEGECGPLCSSVDFLLDHMTFAPLANSDTGNGCVVPGSRAVGGLRFFFFFWFIFLCLSNLSAELCVVPLCVTQCDSSCRGSKPVSDPVTDPVDDSAHSRDSNMESDCRLQKCSQGGLLSSVER